MKDISAHCTIFKLQLVLLQGSVPELCAGEGGRSYGLEKVFAPVGLCPKNCTAALVPLTVSDPRMSDE